MSDLDNRRDRMIGTLGDIGEFLKELAQEADVPTDGFDKVVQQAQREIAEGVADEQLRDQAAIKDLEMDAWERAHRRLRGTLGEDEE